MEHNFDFNLEYESFAIGDVVDIELDNMDIHGEIIEITDKDDFILKTKRIVDKYYISKYSIVKRIPNIDLSNIKGACLCVVPGEGRDMDDFNRDYPEKDDSDKPRTSNTNVEPLSEGLLARLRESVHSYLFDGGTCSIRTFQNIRDGKPGFKEFYQGFRKYRYLYAPEKFKELVKKAIQTKQLDELFKEERPKIYAAIRKNRRF